MERTRRQLNAASKRTPVTGNDATPFSQQMVALTKQAYIALKWKANYWQAQYERLLKREADLKAQVATHEATIRDLKQRLYGKKSEQGLRCRAHGGVQAGEPPQTGATARQSGHGRSDRSALPVVDEIHDLDAAAACCPSCGEPFWPFPGTEESSIIEVQVQAHRRRIYRPRYQKMCGCAQVPGLLDRPAGPACHREKPIGGVGLDPSSPG